MSTRWHKYASEAGYSAAVATGGRRLSGELRFLQVRLMQRWSPIVAIDADGMRIFVSTRDNGVARQVLVHRAYEARLMAAAIEVLVHVDRHPFTDDDALFLDIGANIGTGIVQAVCHHGASGGVAFEPDPDNVALLRHNLLANRLTESVAVVPCALTNVDGDVTLERSADMHGDHRVRTGVGRQQDTFGESRRPVITVPGVTLDAKMDAGDVNLARVRLVSIDTQGHEGHVLAGARQLSASEVPIIVEYWPYGLRAGGGYELFADLVARSFVRYVHLDNPFDAGRLVTRPVTDIFSLDDGLGDVGWANLLLLSQ